MKYLFLAIAIFTSPLCQSQIAHAILDENDSRITVTGEGMFINAAEMATKTYEIPQENDFGDIKKATIFQGAVWIGGLDQDSSLHLSAMTYRQRGQDFWAGPSSTNSHQTRLNHDKVYKVSKTDIAAHIQNPSAATGDILDWPGNGDTTIGEPWQLAPYIDENSNGIYEPTLGDYPKIIGEVAAYCIYNDNDVHTESGGEPLNIDIHQLFYQESKGLSGGVLDFTNLAWFKVVNRSQNTYHDMKFGLFVDFDLGNFADDYVGCDTVRNMFYAYNGDDEDEGVLGYGLNPPAQGVSFMNHPLISFMSYNNNTNPIGGNPDTAYKFWNYMSGKWLNGQPIDTGDTNDGYFFYPGDPVSGNGITESSIGNYPADRRGLGVTGPFDLAPGESFCVDVGFVYSRSTFGGPTASITTMRQLDSYAKQTYYNDLLGWESYGCNAGNETSGVKSGNLLDGIYPNPTNGIVHLFELPKDISKLEVLNSIGQNLGAVNIENNQIDLTHLKQGIYILRSPVGSARILKY